MECALGRGAGGWRSCSGAAGKRATVSDAACCRHGWRTVACTQRVTPCRRLVLPKLQPLCFNRSARRLFTDSLSVSCRPVWLPAYALEWAGGEYADVLLGEGPSCCRGARARGQVHSFVVTRTHLVKSQCMLCRHPGLLLRGGDQPADGRSDIPAPWQDRAPPVVRRFPLKIRQWPRRERSGQAWVFCVVVLGHSLLELASKALLQTEEALEVQEPVLCCILTVLRQHGLQDTRCFWTC